MPEVLASRRFSVEDRVLGEGVRQASARSDDPILCVARGSSLAFVVVSGLRLVASWEFPLHGFLERPAVFIIPRMIVTHLLAAQAARAGTVDLVLSGEEVTLITADELGAYELRWRSNPRSFPAPAEMSRLLVPPPSRVRLSYLHVSDAVHQSVLELVDMESQRQIHRTRLAVMVNLSDGCVSISGREIEPGAADGCYFDPRLVIRALELIRAEFIEIGLTALSPRTAFLSMVNRAPDRQVHCALLSIGLDTQLLFPVPRSPGL